MNTHEPVTNVAGCRASGFGTVASRTGHVALERQVFVFKDRLSEGNQFTILDKLSEIGIAWNRLIHRCIGTGLMKKNKPTAGAKGQHKGRESTDGAQKSPVHSHEINKIILISDG